MVWNDKAAEYRRICSKGEVQERRIHPDVQLARTLSDSGIYRYVVEGLIGKSKLPCHACWQYIAALDREGFEWYLPHGNKEASNWMAPDEDGSPSLSTLTVLYQWIQHETEQTIHNLYLDDGFCGASVMAFLKQGS